MHPAFSVLFFTVTSGAGYGLLTWLAVNDLFDIWPLSVLAKLGIGLLALVLITLGLLSSTLHLANPKNAWKSFSRFRTSWLSREAVLAILLYPLAGIYALTLWCDWSVASLFALLAGLLSMSIVFVTSMIYASLKTIRQWHTPAVPLLFLLFAGLSGGLLFATCMAFLNIWSIHLINGLLILSGTTCVVTLGYYYWFKLPSQSNIQTATGFTHRKVDMLDAGHSAPAFLNKEFMYDVARAKLIKLRVAMLLLTFVVPAVLMLFADHAAYLLLAWAAMMLGLLMQRWLFFAEARHVVRLYHGYHSV